MIECKRAEFFESLGVDTAKLCDMCDGTCEPDGICFALETIKDQAIPVDRVALGKRHPKLFTFNVCTDTGNYVVRAESI